VGCHRHVQADHIRRGRIFEHLVRLEELPFEVKVFMNLERAWTWLRPGEPPFQPH
jgi:hypothetical protein